MLTREFIENIKTAKNKKGDFYNDSEYLFLRVFPTGTKKWCLKYTQKDLSGKSTPKLETIGTFPDMSAKDARKTRDIRKLEFQQAKNKPPTLKEICDNWYNDKTVLMAESTRYNQQLYLSYIPENLLNLPLDKITKHQLVNACKAIKESGKKKKTLTGVCSVLKRSYDHAIANGLFNHDNPANNLITALGFTKEESEIKHFASMHAPDDIGKLLRGIDNLDFDMRNFLWFIALTQCRLSELRSAQWKEIDLENAVWHIPAEHTKKRRCHDVPLCRQAVEILKHTYIYNPKNLPKEECLIFPSLRTGGELSPSTPITALKTLQTLPDCDRPPEMTVHGFRSMFSTLANESGEWTADAIEFQLAHVQQNQVRAAYYRGNKWNERVKLVQWYADLLDDYFCNDMT